ncbi:Hsp33 family molecular chaperone [Hyphobacterium sp. CCMP332]|uniref:Hsp33 family molecular chaperone n=1 Tax=Hyphobacterium sp. CCMP332 TaxID=2749086 RepID=UPI00164EF36C|nr:Hsp33 family molecular chaperone [Hyphobacterium sp. CCMP332]QNL19410.1 Hsp33 family molecular chaperone [Hyphobacterium sp. CCMP332]
MSDPLGEADDLVAAFQVDGHAARGRIVRMGAALDDIVSAHDHPPAVKRLVGEAVLLAALVGDSLKFDGRLIVQANGNGPVNFVVAEWNSGGAVRGFAQYSGEPVSDDAGVAQLLGTGSFAMTIDPGGEMERYQGVVALEGDRLSHCAERYFEQSEQTPTRIRLAVGENVQTGGKSNWRGGGAILQQIAGDEARGDASADWDHCRALFETIADDELIDPDISAATLIYRLFHEDGARLFEPRTLTRHCPCNRERLVEILARFSEDEQAEMEKDGKIGMTCEYCNRLFEFTPEDIDTAKAS